MLRAEWIRRLQAPQLAGWQALLCGLVAVWLPTVIRLAVNGVITGCEFTPYLPFVLICAILLRWWQAGAVAVASVALLGGLFGGSAEFEMSCFMPAAAIFLASSAAIIGVAVLIRRGLAALQKRGANDSQGRVMFSIDKGEVWASWYGQGSPVLLGSQRRVAETMKEFLAQAGRGKGG